VFSLISKLSALMKTMWKVDIPSLKILLTNIVSIKCQIIPVVTLINVPITFCFIMALFNESTIYRANKEIIINIHSCSCRWGKKFWQGKISF